MNAVMEHMRLVPQQRFRRVLALAGVLAACAGAVMLRPTTGPSAAETLACGTKGQMLAVVAELASAQPAETALLARAARADDPDVAAAAVLAMTRINGDSPARDRAVLTALDRSEPIVRQAAVVAYRRVFSVGRAPEPSKVIAMLQDDPSLDVRLAAARSLGHLHVFDALPVLLKAMDDPASAKLREQAAAAAMRILTVRMDFDARDAPQRRKVIAQLRSLAEKPVVRRIHADWLKRRRARPPAGPDAGQ